jgi:hypothetical protein
MSSDLVPCPSLCFLWLCGSLFLNLSRYNALAFGGKNEALRYKK